MDDGRMTAAAYRIQRDNADRPRSSNHPRLNERRIVGSGCPVFQWVMMPAGRKVVHWTVSVKVLAERLEEQ